MTLPVLLSVACALHGKALPPDTRVEISATAALVTVQGRAGASLEVRSGDAECVMVGNVARLTVIAGVAEFSVQVPSAVALSVVVQRGSITVDGIEGPVVADGGSADVEVSRVNGAVTARSATARVSVRDVAGRVEAAAQNNEVRLERVRGDVRVTNVSGLITMTNVTAANVVANAVSGAIACHCSANGPGTWEMRAHTGSVTVVVTPDAAFVATLDAPPGAARWRVQSATREPGPEGGRKVTVVRGSGATRMLLSSFSGGVFLEEAAR